ncbi:hypothetical protein F4604DRAFT_1686535 [Suillus subluteus]|nr:hypothetical protein F4604DRAFT_1686535 [Suillus subluteus]
MAQLEPLLPWSALQFPNTWDGPVSTTPPLERPLVPQSFCSLGLGVVQCMPLVSGSCLLGLGLSAVHATLHATCQWLLLIGTGALRSACHLSVAPALEDWGIKSLPLVSSSQWPSLLPPALPRPSSMHQVLSLSS